jgi:hypothetical protein
MRVFICSTCYDLIDLRAELERFFLEAGIEPILSDSLNSEFQVMPDRNSIETCLANVRGCDEFVIILSNRYGPSLAAVGFDDISATHLEYKEAVRSGKRISMFVRDRLEADYNIWKSNGRNPELKLLWCKELNDRKIFNLLEEHRTLVNGSGQNNWIWPFRDSIELKGRLTVEFKNSFNRALAAKLMTNGRIPFFEIIGQVTNYHVKDIYFELQIRNLGNTVAVSPVFEITATVNKWPLASLADKELKTLTIHWAYQPTIILQTRLNYSILEGHKFIDEGTLTIHYDTGAVQNAKVIGA